MKKLILTMASVALGLTTTFAQFEGTFTMSLESAKLKEPMNINMSVKGNLTCMEIPAMVEAGFVKSVINNETQSMIMCTDKGGRKIGMKQDMNKAGQFMPQSENAKPPVFTETTESKIIDGYKCRKVIMETDDSKNDMWMTTDLKLNMKDLLSAMSANKSPASITFRSMSKNFGDHPGVSIETTITNKKTNETAIMTLRNVKPGKVDEKVFNTDDFQLMEMPTMGGGQIHK